MKSKHSKAPAERVVKDIRRATRKQYSAEEKIRIVLEALRGDDSIAELCRQEGLSQGVYYKWSKDFMESGKRRLAGDTSRAANPMEKISIVQCILTGWTPFASGSATWRIKKLVLAPATSRKVLS